MNQIDKIKAEIERLKNGDFSGTYDARYALNIVLSFIESLEKEPKVDLDKEIEEWFNRFSDGAEHVPVANLFRPNFTQIARYFYDLGCRHAAAEYDDIEYERQRREEEDNY